MRFATAILLLMLLIFVGVLPMWPFSRAWGFAPAILVGAVLLVLLVMALTGQVPGLSSR
jgi:hypothetical protein